MLNWINKNYKFILILIILATLLLRILPFESRSWAMDADSQIVKEALQIGQGIAQGDWQFLKEPILFPFIGPYIYLFFYGIFFVFGKLLYLFNNADEFISYIFLNIQDFYWWSRILVGIFGALLVPLVFFATRRIMQKIDEKKAIIFSFFAAVLTALNLILVIFSEKPRPHVLVAFFIFLTFYFYLRFLDHKKIRDYFLLSLSCGLAIGVLQNGIFAVIFFILASYYLFKDNTYFAWLKFIMAGIIILGIFAISYPYAILNFSSVSEVEQGKFESVNGFDFTLSSGSQTFSGLNGKGFNVFVKGLFFYHPTLSFVFILFLLIFIFLKFNLFAFLKNNLFCHPNDFSCHPDESRDLVSGSRVKHGMTDIKVLDNIKNYFDYIIPVPLHKTRQLWRGFNQAELLAQEISKEIKIPVLNDIIFRIKNTKSQVKKGKKEKRQTNIQGAFQVNDKYKNFVFVQNSPFCHSDDFSCHPDDFTCHPDESRDLVSGSRVKHGMTKKQVMSS